MEVKTKYAIVTLTNSKYLLGNIVLYYSLKENGMRNDFIVLYDELTENEIKILNNFGITTKKINKINNPYEGSVGGVDNKLRNVFSKLYCWTLIEYEKVIFIDNDILNMKNFENLFELELKSDEIYGAKDNGFTFNNRINTGFILLKPNIEIFNDLIEKTNEKIYSYNNSDQGFLNTYFKNKIKYLEDEYNLLKRRKEYEIDKIINLHFVGNPKPWINGGEKGYERYNNLWIQKYNEYIEKYCKNISDKKILNITNW